MAVGSYKRNKIKLNVRYISVRFDDDVFDEINKIAFEKNVSFSKAVNRMIRKHLERHKRLEKK